METPQHKPIDRQQVITRLATLDSARAQLKKEFIGIDRVIDELMDSISTWYTLPELQTRPLVVNLWGMTGTGKTSLIKRLADLIDMAKANHVLDFGNSADGSAFYSTLDDIFEQNNGRPFILMLDEFQHARTVNELGLEHLRGRMGSIWTILDTGRFSVYSYPSSELYTVREHRDNLRKCISQGVMVKRGRVVKGHREYLDIMGLEDHTGQERVRPFAMRNGVRADNGQFPFYPLDSIPEIRTLTNDMFCGENAVGKHLRTLDGPKTIEFLDMVLDEGKRPKVCDCSQSLVIVAGNLDEAYSMAKDVNPDIPAEVWRRLVKDIGLSEVKKALQERFRAEQIARLGNNHIIYPAMGERDFRDFIRVSLAGISADFLTHHGMRLSFTRPLIRLIYKEGVYPTQGFRPVISTIDQMVRSKVSEMVGHVLLRYPDTTDVLVGVASGRLTMRFSADGRVLGRETNVLKLSLTQRRRLRKDDDHAIVALHEAGHVVCGSLLLNEVPEVAVAVSSESRYGGFVVRSGEDGLMNRSRVIRVAAYLLGGHVAEQMIFGKEGSSNGSGSDIERATETVRSAIARTGMGLGPISFQSVKGQDNDRRIDRSGEVDTMTEKYLREAEELARQVLEEERNLLLAVAERLFNDGTLTRAEMQTLVSEHALRSADERIEHLSYRERLLGAIAAPRPLQKVA